MITPGRPFAATGALVTNFHLPRSTLLALVMAFAGVEPGARALPHGDRGALPLLQLRRCDAARNERPLPRHRHRRRRPHRRARHRRTARCRRPSSCRWARKASVKAMLPAELRDARRADRARQTPTTCTSAPARSAIAALGGLHRFMRLGRPDPDRLRRLPGVLAAPHRRTHRRRRRRASARSTTAPSTSFTPELAMRVQRLLGSDIAMALRRVPAGRRRPRAASRRRCGAPACGRRAAAPQPRAAGQLVLRDRAGRHRPRPAPQQRRGDRRARLRRLRDRRPVGGGGARARCSRRSRGDRRAAAGRPAALPDGRRRPRRPRGGDRAAASTCSTACCPRGSAAPARRSSRAGASTCATPPSRDDDGPLVAGCSCPACAGFSRAYIRHLVTQSEISGLRLLTIHNLHQLLDLAARARAAIAAGRLGELRRELAEATAA